MEMEARVGRVKSLFTMAAFFQILFLVWGGLSFERLADSGSPRPFLWSSRPHSPPVGDSNWTIRRAEACQGWTSSPVPAARRLRDLDVSTSVFAGLTTLTYANLPYVHCLSADPATAPASTNTMTAGSCVLCSYLRPQDTICKIERVDHARG